MRLDCAMRCGRKRERKRWEEEAGATRRGGFVVERCESCAGSGRKQKGWFSRTVRWLRGARKKGKTERSASNFGDAFYVRKNQRGSAQDGMEDGVAHGFSSKPADQTRGEGRHEKRQTRALTTPTRGSRILSSWPLTTPSTPNRRMAARWTVGGEHAGEVSAWVAVGAARVQHHHGNHSARLPGSIKLFGIRPFHILGDVVSRSFLPVGYGRYLGR